VTERLIIAGFGGQGVMLIGKLYAAAAMHTGKEVTFMPSYGAEVRGGTAHGNVIISDEPIHSPVVEMADALIVMNQPSYDKFRPRLRPGGRLFINSSMAQADTQQEADSPARVVALAATDLAEELGNTRVANVIMLGAYSATHPGVPAENILAELAKGMTGRKAHMLEINCAAFQKGRELGAGG